MVKLNPHQFSSRYSLHWHEFNTSPCSSRCRVVLTWFNKLPLNWPRSTKSAHVLFEWPVLDVPSMPCRFEWLGVIVRTSVVHKTYVSLVSVCSMLFFFLFLKRWNLGWVSAQRVVPCPRSCVKCKVCVFLGKRKPPILWFVVMSLRWSEQVRKMKLFVSSCRFFCLDFSWKALGEGKKVWVYPWVIENQCVVGVENVQCLRACILILTFYVQDVLPTP